MSQHLFSQFSYFSRSSKGFWPLFTSVLPPPPHNIAVDILTYDLSGHIVDVRE